MDRVTDMRRLLLTLSYDGTRYAGWQWQANAVAVQQRVEEALGALTGETVRVTGASRTDAGVHALGQRAHFDTRSRIPADKLPFALNTHLPPDIRALEAREVPPGFHARFDARGKRYTYRIHNAPHASALFRSLTFHVPQRLDVPADGLGAVFFHMRPCAGYAGSPFGIFSGFSIPCCPSRHHQPELPSLQPAVAKSMYRCFYSPRVRSQ